MANILGATRFTPLDMCMAVVLLCVVVDLLGLSLTIPILANYAREVMGHPSECPEDGDPDYDEKYDSSSCQDALDGIKAMTGYLSSAYAVAMLISTMWMPVFSDKYGRRPAIIVSLFGSLAGFLGQGLTCATDSSGCGIPGGFGMLIGVRVFAGLFGGTTTVAAAFIVDLYPQEQRGKMFARLGSSAITAFVFGPFVGGGLAQFGLRVPLFMAAVLSFVAMLLAFRYVQEPQIILEIMAKKDGLDPSTKRHLASLQKQAISPKKDEETPTSKDIELDSVRAEASKTADDSPGTADPKETVNFNPMYSVPVYLISAQTMCTTIAFNALSSLLALVLLEDRLGVVGEHDSTETQGQKVALWVMVFAPSIGFTQVLVLQILYPRAVERLGLLTTGAVGCFTMGIGIVAIPFWPEPGYFFITTLFMALGNGLSTNVSNTFLSSYAPKGLAARTLAYGAFADAIGNIVGPLLTQIYAVDRSLPFFVAAGFGWLGSAMCLMLMIVYRPTTDKDKDKGVVPVYKVTSQVQKERHPGQRAVSEDELLLDPAEFKVKGTGELAERRSRHTVAIIALANSLYDNLSSKNHMWGFDSTNKKTRAMALQIHKDTIDDSIPYIRPPDEKDQDKAFQEDSVRFLIQHGHEKEARKWCPEMAEYVTSQIEGLALRV